MNIELNKIYCMDCLEGMKQMEDNSVDSIVTDPPYGLSFMGKKWDYDVPSVEIWKEVLRVLKPGGMLLSFAGSRTYHRMAVNIEDAGFEIRDQIMWVYGSGFPKSLNIGKAIDKLQGNEREEVGINPNARDGGGNIQVIQKKKDEILTKGTSEWEGWGTALKPAHEPIVLARKPLSEKNVATNVLKWGTGGINIDECRIGFISEDDEKESKGKNQHSKYPNSIMRNPAPNGIYNKDLRPPTDYVAQGRFPANFIHDGSEEVVELLNETARFFYCAKTSKKDRNEGLEEFEEKRHADRIKDDGTGGDNSRNRTNNPKKNFHPTVKPTELMKYLIKLVTHKDGIVLDPFMGSGSTGKAATQLGIKFIGFEMDEEYCKIAKARCKNNLQEWFK